MDKTATWPPYEAAHVLDMLATPGPFNIGGVYDHPLTDEMIANVRRSGITAVNVTCSPLGSPAFNDAVNNIAYWEREFDAHPDVLMKVKTLADIDAAKRAGKLGIILGFQDAAALGEKVDRVDMFRALGVRIIQLTYNARNLLGDGCPEPANAGLSRLGEACVRRMNEVGILVDLSHVGRQSSWDAVRVSTKPVAVTHGGASAIADVARNKPDDLLKAIADTGGMIGVYLMPFLRESGAPSADDFFAHLEHILNLCGEDHVGIGTDQSITPLDITPEFRAKHVEIIQYRRRTNTGAPGEAEDVFTYVEDFNSPRRMELIAAAMSRRGHSDARIEKVLGKNWLRVLKDTWKA
jgi:membrane dipeptidase